MTPTATTTPCGSLSGVLTISTFLASGCQYEVTSNVLVPEGVTLSVPSGAVLKFNATVYMRVDGAIVADGAENDPVVFTRNGISPWSGLRITEKSKSLSSLSNTIFEYAQGERAPGAFAALNAENAQPSLSNLTFRYNAMPFYLSAGNGYTLTLKGGKVFGNSDGGYLAFGGNVIDSVDFFENSASSTNAAVSMCPGNSIINSTFTDNNMLAVLGTDCSSSEISYIRNNTISNNRGAIAVTNGYSVTIQTNDVYGNSQVSLPSVFQFSNMQAAIVVRCATTLTGNNIYSNTSPYAIRSRPGDCDIDATNNWWGTAITNEVDSLIYDYYDDFTLGKVIYEPISAAPFP